MSIRVRRKAGRPSNIQRLIEGSLTGVAKDLIAWQDANGRTSTGRSKQWLIILNRYGNQKPADISGELIGVPYINYALFGRGKSLGGSPPLTPAIIMRWLKARGIRGRDFKTGKYIKDLEFARKIVASISKYGTKALQLSPDLQFNIYTRNLRKNIDLYAPKIAEETAAALVKGFANSFDNLKNINVKSTL